MKAHITYSIHCYESNTFGVGYIFYYVTYCEVVNGFLSRHGTLSTVL